MAGDLKFEAKDERLSTVFFAQRKYRVPRYQRPYSWDDEQVSEFWEDLITSDEPYFLGSMIFNTESESKDGYVDIIDGQQRLLTITILTAVLRDVAKQIDEKKADLIQRKNIAIEDLDGNQFYRILPAELLVEYFAKYIQSNPSNILESHPVTREEGRVKQNYEYFLEKIYAELNRFSSSDTKLDEINKLRKKLSELIVISVEIAKEEDAYEIFETTNARGLELSVADLLKNLIFKRIHPTDDKDSAKAIWQEITTNVESTNTELKKFIRYFWISKYSFVPEKKLYRAIKTKLTDWQRLLDELKDTSQIYNRLLESNEEDFRDLKHGHKIYESISAVRLMQVSQCYVLLLSLLRNFNRLGTDPTRTFQLIEKFTFQYSVVSKLPTNRVERIYSKYALKIESVASDNPDKKVAGKVLSIFSDLEKELKSQAPSEDVFNEGFRLISYRNSADSRALIKYILARINAHYTKTDEQLIDFSAVNIEHLLPQKPRKDSKLSRKDIRGYVNKLGNLTLLSKKINSIAQNSPIKQKLPELERSELAITKVLVRQLNHLEGKWEEEEIMERQDEFARLAYNHIWKI